MIMKHAKSKKIKIIFLVLIVALVICASVVANYFSSSLFIGSAQNYSGGFTAQANECYLISIAKSQSELEAKTLAGDYEECGAAGYIWKQNEYYHVIFSAHENQNDASLVQEALQERLLKTQIIKVILPPYSFEGDFTASQHAILQHSASSFMQSFRTLADLAVGIETNVYSNSTVQEKLQKLQNSANSLCEEFNSEFANSSQNKIVALGEYLADQLETIMLTNVSAANIKYHAVEILDIYKNMCTEFNS